MFNKYLSSQLVPLMYVYFHITHQIEFSWGLLVLPKLCKNCVVCQVLWRMCSIAFLAFTLKLPIRTLLLMVPKHSVFWRATQFQLNEHIPIMHRVDNVGINCSTSNGNKLERSTRRINLNVELHLS